jgi:hypothetical protein
MGSSRSSKKRPCRICRKWFLPHARLGDRQKTCGESECQRQWHRRQCAKWNKENRSYFQEIHLRRRLEALSARSPDPPSDPQAPPCPPPMVPPAGPIPLDYPRDLVQEVIGAQQLVIVDYFLRLLLRGLQAAIKAQVIETAKEFRLLPAPSNSRDDGHRGPSQGISSA